MPFAILRRTRRKNISRQVMGSSAAIIRASIGSRVSRCLRFDRTLRNWSPEGAPSVFRNQPGGMTDPSGTTYPNAYMFDRPVVYPGQTKMFETVAVVPGTAEILGAVKWGVEGHKDGARVLAPDKDQDVDDRPTAGFLVAVDTFYAQPPTVGPDIQRPERYDAKRLRGRAPCEELSSPN